MTNRTIWDERARKFIESHFSTDNASEEYLEHCIKDLQALLAQPAPPAEPSDVEKAKKFFAGITADDLINGLVEHKLAGFLATARREALEQAANEIEAHPNTITGPMTAAKYLRALASKAEEPSRSVQKRLAAQKAEPK